MCSKAVPSPSDSTKRWSEQSQYMRAVTWAQLILPGAGKPLHCRAWGVDQGPPRESCLHSIPDVTTTELILEGQQVDVHIISALNLLWQLPPPYLLPLCMVRASELKGHGDASVHGFIQVMGPAINA